MIDWPAGWMIPDTQHVISCANVGFLVNASSATRRLFETLLRYEHAFCVRERALLQERRRSKAPLLFRLTLLHLKPVLDSGHREKAVWQLRKRVDVLRTATNPRSPREVALKPGYVIQVRGSKTHGRVDLGVVGKTFWPVTDKKTKKTNEGPKK